MVKKLLEHFMKTDCKKYIKKSLELKKWSRKKVINYMSNGSFNSWIYKEDIVMQN